MTTAAVNTTVAVPAEAATISFNGMKEGEEQQQQQRMCNGNGEAAVVELEMGGLTVPGANKPRQRRRTSIINEPKEPPIREQ